MSSHSSRGRHPDPSRFNREHWPVGHVTFEIVAPHPKQLCSSFALIAGESPEGTKRKPLFTGVIHKGMGTQMRRLAHRFDELEAEIINDEHH